MEIVSCSLRDKKDTMLSLCEIPDILFGEDKQPLIERALQNPFLFGFWDSTGTQKCLRQKSMLFLGDSTMEETIDDLVMLLSGIGSNVSTLGSYLFDSSLASHIHPPYKKIELPRNITVEYFGGRRNVTVTSNVLGLRIRYRFTGHHNLLRNFEGILTFFHNDFSAELDCLLGERGSGCVRPSIVVLNSGLHDSRGHNNASTFSFYLKKLLSKIQEEPSTRVIWKANIISEEIVRIHNNLPVFDDLARSIGLQRHVEYVNSTLAYEILSQGASHLLQKTSTDNFLHIGSIAKDKFHRERHHRKPYSWHSLAMSSLATQLLLNKICRSIS